MSAGQTTIPAVDGGLTVRSLLAGSDGTNIALGHTLFDVNGAPLGTSGNPFSVNVLSGGGSNASIGTGNVTAPTSATAVGTVDGTGKLQLASASNPIPVTGVVTGASAAALALDASITSLTAAVTAGRITPPLQIKRTDTAATGNTLNSATSNVAYTVTLGNGEAVATFNVSGLTASGATLTVEASDDGGTTWATVNGITPATGVLFTTLTADQQFRVNVAGRTAVRLRVSSTGTGTITIASNTSAATGVVSLSTPIPNLPSTVDTNTGAAGASTLRVALANSSTVAATPSAGSPTDRSWSTTANSTQTIANSNTSRKALSFQVPSTLTGGLYITVTSNGSPPTSGYAGTPVTGWYFFPAGTLLISLDISVLGTGAIYGWSSTGSVIVTATET